VDALNKSQEIDLGSTVPIPSFEEHERAIKKLWRTCILLGSVMFVGSVLTLVFFARRRYDLSALLGISTMTFQVVGMTYGAAFLVPAFLTSLKRMGLSVRMMYEGNRLGVEGARAMKEIRDDMKPILLEGREVVKTVHKAIVEEGLLKQVAADMKAIRTRIDRDTTPLKPVARPVMEDKSNGRT
jgi:hypothetical protein